MPSNESPADQAKQQVALISLAIAVALFAFKLVIGLHTRSLGILAEAAHSALDLLATLLTWFSLRLAARPADANHPFGHGKVENFSAFLETGLLILTALAIGTTALYGWITGAAPAVRMDAWAFLVMATSIAVDWRRSGLLRRAATAYASDALAADALNFSSDMATSVAVLVGLAAVAVGQHWHVGWLAHADAVAACVVAAAMLGLAAKLGRRTAGVLLDEVPPALLRELRQTLDGVEGVAELERLRLRRVGSRYFVDLHLTLDPASTLEGADQVRREIAARIERRLPQADVVIEVQPRKLAPLSPFQMVQAIAHRHNLSIHDLSIYDSGAGDSGAGELDIEFHLELRETLPLAEAHDRVSRLEAEMREQVPNIRQIVTHIEPELARVSTSHLLDPLRFARQLGSIAGRVPGVLDCHDIQLRDAGGHVTLSCHCSFPGTLPVGRVHDLVTQLEADIKRELPNLYRVTIHPEPSSDNRR